MQNEYKVYMLKDVLTDEVVYVGLTKLSLTITLNRHRSRFRNKPKFKIELVTDFLTKNQAVELEMLLIKQYNLLQAGYNKSPGSINGNSNYHSEEQKAKWSEERKGKPVSPEHAEKNKTARIGHTNPPDRNYFSKPVMCLNDGKEFSSGKAAAAYYNVNYTKVSAVCNGTRFATKGLRFVFIKR